MRKELERVCPQDSMKGNFRKRWRRNKIMRKERGVSGDKKSQRMRRKKTVKSESGRLVECIGVWASKRERGSTLGEEGENVLIHKNTASNQCTALSGCVSSTFTFPLKDKRRRKTLLPAIQSHREKYREEGEHWRWRPLLLPLSPLTVFSAARVHECVCVSLSLPPSRAFLLPTSHCRAAANPQPHSQSRRTATTYYLKTRENKGIPQDPQRGEEGQTTESSASYLSEISHSSHSGIIPFFLTLRRRERKPDRERVRESARSNNRRIGRKLHHCCAGVAAAPAVLLPPSPPLLPQHHPSPPLEKLMDYC